jgi:OOP family OmpA-OmpF porin
MRKNTVPYIFLGLAALLAISAGVLYFMNSKSTELTKEPISAKQELRTDVTEIPALVETQPEPMPAPEQIDLDQFSSSPSALLARIAEALAKNDMASVSKLINKDALSPEDFEKLRILAESQAFQVRKHDGIREVGEIKRNRMLRWALEFEKRADGPNQILFDLLNENGKWSVQKMTIPAPENLVDSLRIADSFIQAVMSQEFELACKFTDGTKVSDAKIAALCILFEESKYRLRQQKPLRAMFDRGDTVGYLANIESKNAGQSGQFGLNLQRKDAAAAWLVVEVNLDELLCDYAKRLAGGDVYYSPLVKNPAGGDTLALYFEFDEDSISPRTQRQLEIIVAMLKSDPVKKITLSGHTDALGTDRYNDDLSAKRANAVRDFLSASGVPAEQIVTVAKGASQPRRPNVTESGADDPLGRRANRRTEIYLDF